LPFLFAVLSASYLMVLLFRKRWLLSERLSFPLMRVPLVLIERPSILASVSLFYVLTLVEEALFKRFNLRWGYGGMFVWGNI